MFVLPRFCTLLASFVLLLAAVLVMTQTLGLVHGITHTLRLVIFGGGSPIRIDGALVGAVGVSGGSTEQDRAIAEAAAQVVGAS